MLEKSTMQEVSHESSLEALIIPLFL